MKKEIQTNKVAKCGTALCLLVCRAATRCGLLLTLLPGTARAELNFQPVILDNTYIAYERDVGDIDGDGDNDVVAIQEGDTTLQVFRAPTWARSTLVTFTGAFRYPRADDFKLADMDGDGDLDVVTRLGDGPTSDGPGIAVWCENPGGGLSFTQHLIGHSPEYVKDIVAVDFDRDRRLDVAMRMDSRTQIWLRNATNWSEVLLTHPPHEQGSIKKSNWINEDVKTVRKKWTISPDFILLVGCQNHFACPSTSNPPS